jgi:hypothetical protein
LPVVAPEHVLASLGGVLEDKNALAAFEQFLVAEFSVENLVFYQQCSDFVNGFPKRDMERNVALAITLYDTFLAPESSFEVPGGLLDEWSADARGARPRR